MKADFHEDFMKISVEGIKTIKSLATEMKQSSLQSCTLTDVETILDP